MFGYVLPPLHKLPQEEADRFRRAYCGLCHTLSERYGQAARFILNYDFTFLAILLSNGSEAEMCSSRCYASPIRKNAYEKSTPAMELAADESVILAYWQARDGVEDHDWFHGLKYRAVAALLEPAYRKAEKLRPEFCTCVCEQLGALRKLEQENCASIDLPADAFARLLAHAADEVANPVQKRVLQQLLYHLGRWVYLVDAADDMKKDAEEGNYNPVSLRFQLGGGIWTEESRAEFVLTLDHSIHMMTTAYELWDFGVWSPILEDTLYSGLFQVGKAVLDGTFRPVRRGEDRKIRKKVEETK